LLMGIFYFNQHHLPHQLCCVTHLYVQFIAQLL
jgi:hypothetical protein